MTIDIQRDSSVIQRERFLADDLGWRPVSPVKRRVPVGIARDRTRSAASIRMTPSSTSRSQRRFHRWTLFAAYTLVWTAHASIVVGVGISFVVLPFSANWYIALPLDLFVIFFATNEPACVLTTLENHIRRRLRMRNIHRFVPHYLGEIRNVLRPVYDHKHFGRERPDTAASPTA
jgi:hypothetical protein